MNFENFQNNIKNEESAFKKVILYGGYLYEDSFSLLIVKGGWISDLKIEKKVN